MSGPFRGPGPRVRPEAYGPGALPTFCLMGKRGFLLRVKAAGERETVHSLHPVPRLNTKRRLLYLKTQFVPRSKNFSSRL